MGMGWRLQESTLYVYGLQESTINMCMYTWEDYSNPLYMCMCVFVCVWGVTGIHSALICMSGTAIGVHSTCLYVYIYVGGLEESTLHMYVCWGGLQESTLYIYVCVCVCVYEGVTSIHSACKL